MTNKLQMRLSLAIILGLAFITGYYGCFGPSSNENSGSSAPVPNALDTTFGTNGVVTTTIALPPSSDDRLNALALQSDGKIIAAGASSNGVTVEFTLARYTITGTLDTTFDTDGLVTTTFSSSNSINALALQTDGKILAAGYCTFSGTHFTLARYTSTGALDAGFGTNGVVSTTILNASYATSVKVQTDGKILVGGYAYNVNNYDFCLARYESTGALDAGFGTNGVVSTTISATTDYSWGVVVQDDGKIILGGNADGGYFSLVRYTAAGVLDTTFGTAGIVKHLVGDGMDNSNMAMTLQPDNKILLAGHAYHNGTYVDFGLARYTATGVLDTTFGGGDGMITTTISSIYAYDYALALQTDGKILVGGMTQVGSGLEDFALVRYTAAGALDTSFGSSGIVTTNISTKDEIFGIVIQPDGKIVVGGQIWDGSKYDFGLARYLK